MAVIMLNGQISDAQSMMKEMRYASRLTWSTRRNKCLIFELQVTIFHLPRTKSAPIDGEDVFWARQPNAISDPERALQLHLLINDHGDNCALFSYTDNRGSQRPLTKTAFLTKLTELGDLLNMQFPHGHGIRIGSTVWNLLRGMPFEVMRVKGRWKSSAFLLYLRRHAEILARYIQQNPQLQEALRRITLPPIR